MQSPLKGVERLAEELRIERVKASDALQELTRQRVEIASLMQSKDDLTATVEDMKEQEAIGREENDALHHNLSILENEYEHLKEVASARETELQLLYNEKVDLQVENDNLKDTLHEREGQLAAYTVRCSSVESRLSAKEELLNKLKTEIQEVRQNHAAIEQSKLDILEELKQQQAWNEELKLELGKFEVMSDGYSQTRSSNDELRAELDGALNSNAQFMEQIRELNLKVKEKMQSESSLEETIRALKAEKDQILAEFRDLEQSCDLVNERVKAEMEASEAAKKRAETVAQGRDFMDRQVQEMQEKHQDMLRRNSALEKELTASKTSVSELQAEVSTLRERLVQTEAAAEQASGIHAILHEMDELRVQLRTLRSEKLRRGIEEDAGVIAPKAVIDRVEESKQIYQGVIQQLTVDVETANTKLHELTRRYEEAQRRAHKLQSLEEELEIYKDLARSRSQESQDATLQIAEGKNRALKVTQEKSNLLHQLVRAEADLSSARAECKRDQDEIASLREKIKSFNAARIAADKKVAEVSTANSRLETSMEELKQKHDALALELDKYRRTVSEQGFTISDLRIRATELENVKADNAALSSKLVHTKADFAAKEKELTLQIEALRHQRATLERELESSREKVGGYRTGFDQSHSELGRLRAEFDAVVVERDRLKRTLADNETMIAEQHLFELKRDMEETAREFNDFEKEKSAKDRVIQQVTSECTKEREKVALLKLQMATLEDKLRVANQELSVYRGIDVYHSSMQAQLHTYRKDRSFNESTLDVSAIRSAAKTERDLGSAFANSLNFASTHRPSSRTSNAASFVNGGVEDEEYVPPSALRSRQSSRSPSPTVEFSRTVPDLMKPSSPILRPAPMAMTAPANSAVSQLARSNSSDRRAMREAQRAYQEEMESKSVVSDLASHHDTADYRESGLDRSYAAEEFKSDVRNTTYDSNIFSFTRPLPRSPSHAEPAPSNLESVVVNDEPAGAASAAHGVSEAERQELLRRRAERKALRDQQLRERILREGGLNSSFSAARGADARERDRDDMSHSSVGSSASAPHRLQQYPSVHRQEQQTPLATAPPSRRQTLGATAMARAISPLQAASQRASAVPTRATLSAANLTTAAAVASKITPSGTAPPYRPGVPDYARARRLLNM